MLAKTPLQFGAGDRGLATPLGDQLPELAATSELPLLFVEADQQGDRLAVARQHDPLLLRVKDAVFQPCLSEKEAERQGKYVIHSARPKGMSLKEFQQIEKCWRRRRRGEPLYDAAKLPPAGDLALKMSEEELRDLLFIHQGNVARLGQGIRDGGGGHTLAELLESGQHAYQSAALPANATAALLGQRRGDCAVVASGSSVQGASPPLGRLIDAHETIVRINQAPTTSSKRLVGSRTTIRLVNNLWTQTYAKQDLRRSELVKSTTTPIEEGATTYITRPHPRDYRKLAHHR